MKNSSDLTVKRFDVSTKRYHAAAETALKNARTADLGTNLPLLVGDDRVGTAEAYTSQGVLGVEFELNASPVAAQLKAMLSAGKAIELVAEFDGNRLVAINVKTELPQAKAEPVAEQTPLEAALDAVVKALSADADDATLAPLLDQLELQTKSLSPESLAHPGEPIPTEPVILEKTDMQTLPQSPAVHTRKQEPYSLGKFILALSDPTAAGGAGLEMEVSQEVAIKSGKPSSTPMVPWSQLTTKAATAQDSITAPVAGVDVGQSLAQPLTDVSLYTQTAGATHLSPLAARLGIGTHIAPAGAFKIPRQVEPIVPTWVARDADLGNDTAGFDTIDATPHTVGIVTEIRRSALIDTRPEMQQIITAAIGNAVRNALDNSIIGAKTQVANAPIGLAQLLAGKTPSLDLGTVADPVHLLTAIRDLNAVSDSERVMMLADEAVRIWGQTTALNVGLNMPMLLPFFEQDVVGNVQVITSGKMAALAGGTTKIDAMFFLGSWSYAHLVLFGQGLEISVNPFAATSYQKGAILVRGILDSDFVVRDPSRFRMGKVSV